VAGKNVDRLVQGYLDDGLSTTLYFRNLEQSEKVGVSFLLREAVAHWCALHHMQFQCVDFVRERGFVMDLSDAFDSLSFVFETLSPQRTQT
jgi:hypothetical protein